MKAHSLFLLLILLFSCTNKNQKATGTADDKNNRETNTTNVSHKITRETGEVSQEERGLALNSVDFGLFQIFSDPITIASSTTTIKAGRVCLNNHYTSTNGRIFYAGADGTEFGPNIKVNAEEFYTKVKTVFDRHTLNNQYYAIRFFHRYDLGTKKWFLTAECGTIEKAGTEVTGNGSYTEHVFQPITSPSPYTSRIDIKNGIITGNSTFNGTIDMGCEYDPNYFNNIYEITNIDISGHVITTGSLHPSLHVSSMIFPWEIELKKLFEHNGFPLSELGSHDNLEIVFSPYTGYAGVSPDISPISFVRWPHLVAIHLRNDGQDLLNTTHSNKIFQNKAANFSSMCPPRCNKYTWSYDLPDI